MKEIVIFKLIFSALGFAMISLAIYKSRNVSMKAKIRNIPFLLSSDMLFFDLITMITMCSLASINVLMFLNSINRVILGFPAFISLYADWSAILTQLFVFICSAAYLVKYDEKLFNFLRSKFKK